ncbi:hypothetical protein, partial [Helicobacter felis]|uniref:hypothetical protein n=1 Tax=Helicobacter felis TaxID=214 RepID=UPI001F24C8EE
AYTGRGSVCAVRVRKKPPFLPPSVPTERANTTRLPPKPSSPRTRLRAFYALLCAQELQTPVNARG